MSLLLALFLAVPAREPAAPDVMGIWLCAHDCKPEKGAQYVVYIERVGERIETAWFYAYTLKPVYRGILTYKNGCWHVAYQGHIMTSVWQWHYEHGELILHDRIDHWRMTRLGKQP